MDVQPLGWLVSVLAVLLALEPVLQSLLRCAHLTLRCLKVAKAIVRVVRSPWRPAIGDDAGKQIGTRAKPPASTRPRRKS